MKNGTPKFNIGDEVYHNTPDSKKGIIVDILYYYSTDSFKYLVATDWSEKSFCTDIEISLNKIF